jgi:hypothetical protein
MGSECAKDQAQREKQSKPYGPQRCSVHAGSFKAAGSTGKLRRRLPVAAKIALVTA